MIKCNLTNEQIKELYLKGLTIKEISKISNVSEVAIWKRLNKTKIKKRSYKEYDRTWAKDKKGKEYLGADGRYWIRNYYDKSRRKTSARRYVVVMEEFLGHPIPKDLVVHHINGNPTDDRIENLRLLTQKEHNKIHKEMRKENKI